MRQISIIIATFNSSDMLLRVLLSLEKQSYPKKYIEIVIVDGGSTDNTVVIARKFKCTVIHNSRVEPLYAKYLGYIRAKGRYIMYLDHDEVFLNPDSIKKKVQVFLENPQVKAVIGNGYRNPDGLHVINRYINEFGDPFSFFIYHLSKNADYFLDTMWKRYRVVKDQKEYTIFDMSGPHKPAIIELAAGGSVVDGFFFKKKFPQIMDNYHLIPHLLYLLHDDYPLLAMTHDDALLHYSSDNVGEYLKKITWRVRNNIFYTHTIGASGFSGREVYQPFYFRFKKYFFLPYALSFIFPLVDALYLMISRKDISYIIHVPLTGITAMFITYYSLLKLIGIKPALTSYDGSTKAYEK